MLVDNRAARRLVGASASGPGALAELREILAAQRAARLDRLLSASVPREELDWWRGWAAALWQLEQELGRLLDARAAGRVADVYPVSDDDGSPGGPVTRRSS